MPHPLRALASFVLISVAIVLGFSRALQVASSAERGAGPEEIRIGVSLPLTGDLKEYGHAVRNGIELAIKRFPERFRKLRLSFEDNRYEASQALTAFRKFQYAKVDLVYSWGEPPLNAVAPLAEYEKLPTVAVSLDPKPAQNKRYVVRSINAPEEFIAPTLAYFRSRGFKKIGVIKADDPYDNAYVSALENSLANGETLSILSNVLPEENDFRAVALKARRTQLDALGLFVYPHQVITLYRNMSAIGFKPPSFGTDVFESKRVVDGAGSGIEGAVYANMVLPKWFAQEYIAQAGNNDQLAYAFNGYAWAAISADLFASLSHRPSAEEIIKLYTSVTGREGGVEFKYHHTPEAGHYWEFPMELKRIEGGAFKSAL